MSAVPPFPGGPFDGIPEALKPNPPPAMPEPQRAGDAMASASPFNEPLDLEAIYANLIHDRPLKLFIPDKHKYPDYEFRIINTIPNEIATAHNKGFRAVTDADTLKLFADLVAGTDKEGKPYRPMLMARPRAVGEHIRERYRAQLASMYAGMDPKNKDLNGKYTKNVDARDGTQGQFTGDFFRIKTRASQQRR